MARGRTPLALVHQKDILCVSSSAITGPRRSRRAGAEMIKTGPFTIAQDSPSIPTLDLLYLAQSKVIFSAMKRRNLLCLNTGEINTVRNAHKAIP